MTDANIGRSSGGRAGCPASKRLRSCVPCPPLGDAVPTVCLLSSCLSLRSRPQSVLAIPTFEWNDGGLHHRWL